MERGEGRESKGGGDGGGEGEGERGEGAGMRGVQSAMEMQDDEEDDAIWHQHGKRRQERA